MLPLTYVMHAPGVIRNLYQAWYWGISGILTKIEITWKYSFWAHHETIWMLLEYILYLMCISCKTRKTIIVSKYKLLICVFRLILSTRKELRM